MAVEHVVHMTSDGVGAPKDPRSAEAAAPAASPTPRDAKGRVVLPPQRLPARPAVIVPAEDAAKPPAQTSTVPMFSNRELAGFMTKWAGDVIDAAFGWHHTRQALEAHPSDENEHAHAQAVNKLAQMIELTINDEPQ